jgi:FixJ family two-component response regulator
VNTKNETAAASESTPIVFVVHGDASVRVTMDWISRAAGFELRIGSGMDEVCESRPRHVPACLVLDAGVWDMRASRALLSHRSETPVIFIAEHGDVVKAVSAMKAGAAEFLMKPIQEHAMLMAVQSAVDRSRAAISWERKLQWLGARYSSLTARERQVMDLVVAGLLNKQVSAQLGINIMTVKVHRHHAMRKMQANSFADLVRMAAMLQTSLHPNHAVHQSAIHSPQGGPWRLQTGLMDVPFRMTQAASRHRSSGNNSTWSGAPGQLAVL